MNRLWVIPVSLLALGGVERAAGQGQTAEPSRLPAFEAVSIKRLPPGLYRNGFGGGRRVQSDPSMLRMRTMLVGELIMYAYSLPSHDQLSGVPEEFREHLYDIDAVTGRPSTDAEERRMLQKALADRFGLVCHWEQREGRTFAISVMGKPRMQETSGEGGPQPRMAVTNGVIGWAIKGASTGDLSAWLGGNLGGPVADKTGLGGHYDFDLRVEPIEGVLVSWNVSDYEEALRRVGIRLTQNRGSVSVLVVDHVETLSVN
jgi:uncharacterized protein (TIGR03435 family)